MKILRVQTKRKREVVDLTETLRRVVAETRDSSGLCHLFVLHTTVAQQPDLDPGTDLDLLDACACIVPVSAVGI
jgi:thiamine phosphate synthase YjbQ (UPF0047 family)